MTKTAVFLVFALIGAIVFSSCENDEIEINESFIENYQGKKEHKIKLCVQKGNGDWHAIEVAKKAKDTHLAKGAIEPGVCYNGKMMDEKCYIMTLTEIMNGIDDDCDGLIDCDDPDLEDTDACDTGCGADVILAETFEYKSLFISTHDVQNYTNTMKNGQAWAIQYCEKMSVPGYNDWRLGTFADYQYFEDVCDSVWKPNDRRPYGLPGVKLITADTEMVAVSNLNPYPHTEEEEQEAQGSVELPKFYLQTGNYSSGAYPSYMILCVHDN